MEKTIQCEAMTPSEKALSLITFFKSINVKSVGDTFFPTPELCALRVAEEVLDVLWDQLDDKDRIIYWEDVKQEIEKL